MDTGKGEFVQADTGIAEMSQEDIDRAKELLEVKHPDHGGWFREDEIIVIRGSRFRVKSVKPTELRLRLLPKE